MNREMRRADRKITEAEAMQLLQNGEYGILSVCDGGLPYGVPLSYIFTAGKIYFHCAKSGRKWDSIAANRRVSFCVVGATQPVYDGSFTTRYESAIVEGVASVIEDDAEKADILTRLCEKYLPGNMDKVPEELKKGLAHTGVIAIEITGISGKRRA